MRKGIVETGKFYVRAHTARLKKGCAKGVISTVFAKLVDGLSFLGTRVLKLLFSPTRSKKKT